jgi:hypothetical protein
MVLVVTPGAEAWTHKILYNFCSRGEGCPDGSAPAAGLVMDSQGNLYGTNYFPSSGEVFELVKDRAWKLNVLYRFCKKENCSDGYQPLARLVIDQDGNLYGTTWAGGTGDGLVFKLVPNADRSKWDIKTIHAFCRACGDGG